MAEISSIEKEIGNIFSDRVLGNLSEDQVFRLESLEERKISFLLEQETFWRLKRKKLWLHEGDSNSKLFNIYANYRKIINTIWEIQNENGIFITSGEDIKKDALSLFHNIYADLDTNEIVQQLEVIKNYPIMFNSEDAS